MSDDDTEATTNSAHPEGAQPAEPAMTDEHRWGEPIPAERQAELQGLLDAWIAPEAHHGYRSGPFAGVRLGVRLTGADVGWLAEQSGRDTSGEVPNLHLETLYVNPLR